MIALLAAGTLILSLGTDQFQQQRQRYVEVRYKQPAPEASLEVVNTDGYPPAVRSRCWWVAGGFGLGTAFASIAGIVAENIARNQTANGTIRNVRANALGMVIGFAVGVGPGMLLGNEARREDNGLARGVVSVLAAGGTAALAYTAYQVF